MVAASEEQHAASAFFSAAGLDGVCFAVYEYLLARPATVEPQIVEALDEPGEVIVDAVDELARAGFVRVTQGRPRLVAILQPDAGVAATLAAAEGKVAGELERLSELRSLSNSLAEVAWTANARREAASFERLVDREAIVSRLQELNHHVQSEIVTCVPVRLAPGALAEARAADEQLFARGVQVRGLYLQSCRNDNATMDYLRWMVENGAELRLAATLPTRFQVFDGRTAVVSDSIHGTPPSAIIVHSPGVVGALLRLFEYAWDGGIEPFAQDPQKNRLTSQQRELVRLLARGAKDESVARQLGVSARTVRRFIADISDLLGTRSRFELGVRCAQLGLTSLVPTSTVVRPPDCQA